MTNDCFPPQVRAWTSLSGVVLTGPAEARHSLLENEEHHTDARQRRTGCRRYHVLITAPEGLTAELAAISALPWQYLIVDEAHRLKNKDSAVASELRSLSTEHLLLLTGTPLQNNTTELWALLSLLDTALFPDLDAFLAKFGTLTESSQVEELKATIRPYLLRRQKSDVLRGGRILTNLPECALIAP